MLHTRRDLIKLATATLPLASRWLRSLTPELVESRSAPSLTASGKRLMAITRNHARIVSMHMKDRKYESNGGDNLPWGQGQTPIREALQLMKKERYKFPATIELEYRTPEGSTVMAEMAKCVKYCKDALA